MKKIAEIVISKHEISVGKVLEIKRKGILATLENIISENHRERNTGN